MTAEPLPLPSYLTHDNVERFSLGGAARRPLRVDSTGGMRAGERKTGWTKPLPPSPGLWALNAPGRLLVGHRGIPGGGLEAFAVPTRLSSGEHSLDLTIWPSGWNADGALGASVPAPA